LYGPAELKDISLDVEQLISVDLDGNNAMDKVCLAKVFGKVYDYNAEDDVPGADWVTVVITTTPEYELSVHQLNEIFLSPDWHLGASELWCLDLTGDGMVEIVEYRKYYEWEYCTIYSFSGRDWVEVSSNGFGV
jgi:hypothetical protein